jgi:import inner membrane translocase subunit TIM8
MPFWSKGSGSSDSGSNSAASKDFSEDISDFDNHIPLSSGLSSSSLGVESAGGLGEMQQFALMLQQQVLVQQVINKLTDKAFDKCITGKPSDSLSGKDAACVQATVMKWLDTNEFLLGRLAKKTQNS